MFSVVLRKGLVYGGKIVRRLAVKLTWLRKYLKWSEAAPGLELAERIDLFRKGFLPQNNGLYDFHRFPQEAFLTDRSRWVYSRRVNSKARYVAHDKLVFQRVLKAYALFLPDLYGFIKDGAFHPEPPFSKRSVATLLTEGIASTGIVLKPTTGSFGEGLYQVSGGGKHYTINGRSASREDLESVVRSFGYGVVQEFVCQAAYAEELYPHSANTVRFLTMWDIERNTPFIARAVQRIGTSSSGWLDNFSAGGLGALIDLETGELGPAASKKAKNGRITWFTKHPETGAPIEGRAIPNWSHVCNCLVEIARFLPFLPYIGWDIIIQENGFKIIEGNPTPGVELLQVHGPMLVDPRIRAFYKHYQVI